jgi:hypothetical protein
MSILRQSYLGSSTEGELCLKVLPPPRPYRTEPLKPLGECFISVLPDEILSQILSYILPKERWDLSKKEERYPLTLVSKDWRRIYEPILFRKIRICSYPREHMLLRIRKLLAVLESRPYLRNYPRIIDLELSNPNATTCRNVANLLKRCMAVRTVSFHTDFTADTWVLLCAIKSLPLLEELSLSGHSSGPSIHLVLENYVLPSLKRLRLSRHGVRKNSADIEAPWPGEPIPINQYDLEKLLPPNRYHTGNVTSLEFSDPSTPPYVTEHILRWPACLVDLSIVWLTHSTASSQYTTEAIQRLLNIHRQSLKCIRVGMIPGGQTGMPDFSNFPCLEQLSMSAYNIMSLETPVNALKKLAAPNLQYLAMNFSPEDQHCESRGDFSLDQVRWMQNFASLRTADYEGSRLEKVAIEFNPSVDPHSYQYRKRHDSARLTGIRNFVNPPTFEYVEPDLTWPWEDLEEARQSVAQHGLTLEYSPLWTKEEWDRIIHDEKVEDPDILEDLQPGLSDLFIDEA